MPKEKNMIIESNPAFHGSISGETAATILKTAQMGDFLLRHSPERDQYFVSIKTPKGIHNYLVDEKIIGGLYYVVLPQGKEGWDKFKSAVYALHQETMGLKVMQNPIINNNKLTANSQIKTNKLLENNSAFHGPINSNEAARRLDAGKPGDYLFRYSQGQNRYFISIKKNNTDMLHLELNDKTIQYLSYANLDRFVGSLRQIFPKELSNVDIKNSIPSPNLENNFKPRR